MAGLTADFDVLADGGVAFTGGRPAAAAIWAGFGVATGAEGPAAVFPSIRANLSLISLFCLCMMFILNSSSWCFTSFFAASSSNRALTLASISVACFADAS